MLQNVKWDQRGNVTTKLGRIWKKLQRIKYDKLWNITKCEIRQNMTKDKRSVSQSISWAYGLMILLLQDFQFSHSYKLNHQTFGPRVALWDQPLLQKTKYEEEKKCDTDEMKEEEEEKEGKNTICDKIWNLKDTKLKTRRGRPRW